MNEQLQHFLKDLITLLQDEYHHSTVLSKQSATKNDAAYYNGSALGYWHTLELIRLQLAAFGYSEEALNEILPPLEPMFSTNSKIPAHNSAESDE